MNYREFRKNNFIELQQRYTHRLAREYIKTRNVKLIDELFEILPDHYQIDNYVLVKGHNPVLRKLYISVYTKESYARMKNYRASPLYKPKRM